MSNQEIPQVVVDTRALFQLLLNELGPQGWWPAESKPEILLGAILVQNTNWLNVERSLQRLKERTNFIPEQILTLSLEELQELIRPSGYFVSKSRTIQAVFTWFAEGNWDYQQISKKYGKELRSTLLKIKGIGFETADVFQVYVFDRPVFIADAYARRLYGRLTGQEYKNYESLFRCVQLPADFTYLEAQEFHGLIDIYSKHHLKNLQRMEESFLSELIKESSLF